MLAELGDLAAPGRAVGALRRTVLAYLQSSSSPQRAAEVLQIAKNTVIYRVKRAEQMLGRSVHEDPTELAAALQLTGFPPRPPGL